MKLWVRLCLIFSFLGGGLIGCTKGEMNPQPYDSGLRVLDLSVVDYTESQVVALLTGQSSGVEFKDIDRIFFHRDEACRSEPVGSAMVEKFFSQGAQLLLEPGTQVSLYLRRASSSDCRFLMTYEVPEIKPGAPTITHTVPSSPSRVSYRPGLFGWAFPRSGQVQFFKDSECQVIAGQGAAQALETTGVALELEENQMTAIYGQTVDVLGQKSPCAFIVEYQHTTETIAGPSFQRLQPISPSNSVLSPRVFGETVGEVHKVQLFGDSGCQGLLAEGGRNEFSDLGLEISVEENSSTLIYGQVFDQEETPSPCVYLATYIHDSIPPDNPGYASAVPESPTNATLAPRIIGVASEDTMRVSLYSDPLCLNLVGEGARSDFVASGVAANIQANADTGLYARAFDMAGNGSSCTYLTQYRHDTIPPELPVFGGTDPSSPTNGTLMPLVFGTPSEDTVAVRIFSDEDCTSPAEIGSGSGEAYISPGIQITVLENTNNDFYVRVADEVGNWSNCGFLGNYHHSNLPAPPPGFLSSFPASPSRTSHQPFILGTVDITISSVEIFSEETCSDSVGSGTAGQFSSSGVQVVLPSNSTQDLYAIATDVFGNASPCTYLTGYIHNTVPPLNPVFVEEIPESPNNITPSPVIRGTALADPASQLPPVLVEFFDSLLCIGKLGEGSPSVFEDGGITVNVAVNAQVSIYARSRDAAGNTSGCIHMVDYIYNNLVPAQPIFLSALPASPSYSRETRLRGSFGASPDFMDRVSVGIYSDSSCLTEVASDVPSVFQNEGILVVAPDNATTQFYGASFNEVGTKSSCNLLTSFRHHDLPIANLQLSSSLDGGVAITWLPDSLASPTPSYSVERSLSAEGPFSVIQTGLMANSHQDKMVSNEVQYFYRVFASNSTGRGQYSEVKDILINSPPPAQAISLLARGSIGRVELTWSGFPQNMSYKILRSTSKGGPYTQLPQIVTTTSFIDVGLDPDTEYYYVVVGFNAAGESLHSNMASAVTWDVPWSPSELRVRVLRSHSSCEGNPALALSWNPPAYYDSFSVMRGGWASQNQIAETVFGTEALICDFGQGEATRAYAIRANWGTGISDPSNPIGYHNTESGNLSVYPGNEEVLLNWTIPTSSSAFQSLSPRFDIYKSSSPSGPFEKLVENTLEQSYRDLDVVNGSSYFYYVQTYTINASDQKAYIGPPSAVRSGTPGPPPSAPTNLTLGENSSGQLVLHWSSPSHYNRFHLYRSASADGPFARVLSTDLRSITGPSVAVGLNYFQVRAQWGDGETGPSNTVLYRHAPITGLTATRGADDIGLSWNPVAGFEEYRVYRSEAFSGSYSLLATVPSESYQDSSALENTGYYYKVSASFSDGTQGLASNPIGSSRLGNNIPRAVSVDNLSGTSFLVNWIGAVPSTPHQVLLSEEEEGSYVLKASGLQGPLIVGGLIPQTQYYIKVRVIVDDVSYESAPVMAETLPPPSPPLASAGDEVVNLSWTPMIGAISYDLQRSEDSYTYSNVATGLGTTSYADSSVENGKIYFYRIQVNFPLGSVVSDHSGAVTPGVQPRVPTGLMVVENRLGTSIRLSWSREEAASRYNIYQTSSSGGFTIPTQSAGGNTNVQVGGLTSGETYYFAVSSVTGSFESALSSEIALVAGPQTPAPLGQVAGPDSIEVSWDPVAGADSYTLYRSVDKYFFEVVSEGIAATSYTDVGLDPDPSYFYQILPIGSGGEFYPRSATSAPVMISVEPMTPKGLVLSAADDSAVDIRWIYTPNVAGYELLRSEVSGGPYTLVEVLGPDDTIHQDSTTTAGNTYFYVIRSFSASGVRSENSTERGIHLVSGPENLVAVNGSDGIDLSWDSVPGATAYHIRRSAYAGAEMGLVGSSATLSWTDEEVIADQEYTYIVEAVFADDTVSPRSNQVSLVRTGTLRLQVPIELIDSRLGSSSLESRTFERSQTTFNPNSYDGVSSYELEIIARNRDSLSRSVRLIDSMDMEVVSISLPPGTEDYTRFKVSFTPNVEEDIYRLELEQTGADLDLALWAARILVNQENATKTRLYFPLLTDRDPPSQGDLSGFIESTSEVDFFPIETAIPFEKRASRLSRIIDYNAWELEALVAVTGDVGGALVFKNTETQAQVPSTYTRFDSSQISVARVPFSEGVSQFGAAQEGQLFQVQVKCEYQCHTGEAAIYKAGLWVTLENLSKAEVVFRNAGARDSITVSEALAQERTYFDEGAFTGPEVYLTAIAQGSPGTSAQVYLLEHMDDSGGVGLVSVAESGLVFDSGEVQVQTTASPLALTNHSRLVTAVDPDGEELDFIGSLLRVWVNP